MRSNLLFLMSLVICNLLLVSCDGKSDEPAVSVVPPDARRMNNMSVIVPIHPSSLEYFDYVIRYTDNRGNEQKDTIQSRNGGAALTNNRCYVKTYTYDVLPVSCSVYVEMVPKKDGDCVASFMFDVPKPYIYFSIATSSDILDTIINGIMGRLEYIEIDSITIDSFRNAYGSIYSSYCWVDSDYGVVFF